MRKKPRSVASHTHFNQGSNPQPLAYRAMCPPNRATWPRTVFLLKQPSFLKLQTAARPCSSLQYPASPEEAEGRGAQQASCRGRGFCLWGSPGPHPDTQGPLTSFTMDLMSLLAS